MCIEGATAGTGSKEWQGLVSNGKGIEKKANKARQ